MIELGLTESVPSRLRSILSVSIAWTQLYKSAAWFHMDFKTKVNKQMSVWLLIKNSECQYATTIFLHLVHGYSFLVSCLHVFKQFDSLSLEFN